MSTHRPGIVFELLERRLSCSVTIPTFIGIALLPVHPLPITTVHVNGLLVTSTLPAILDHRQAYSGPLATFTDDHPGSTPADYAATINWGDGSPAETRPVTVNPDGAGFSVAGTHAYLFGTYYPQVSITDLRSTPTRTSLASETLSVFPPPVAGVAYPLNAVSGQTHRATIATYVGLDVALLSRYAATVSWGDGQTSPGELQPNPDGSVSVVAEHAYDAPGFFDVSVSLSETSAAQSTDGASAARTRATVADGTMVGLPTAGVASSGVPFHGDVVFFKYLTPDHPAPASLRAVVNLLDAEGAVTQAGQIIPAPGGFYVAIDYVFTGQNNVYFDVRVYDEALPASQSADHLTGLFSGTVNMASHLHATGTSFSTTAGVANRVLLGHVVSDDPGHLWNTALSAQVIWTDGTDPTDAELVATPDGGYDVYGTHTYAVTGRAYDVYARFVVTETRTAAAPGLPPGAHTSSLYVYSGQVSHVAPGTFTGFTLTPDSSYGVGTGVIIASVFVGTDLSDGDFSGMVTWFDGTVTPVSFSRIGDELRVTASRVLAPGQYAATLTVRAGTYAQALDVSAYVAEPYDPSEYVLHATITAVPAHAFVGGHFHGVVATFTLDDADPTPVTAYLTYPWSALVNVVATVVHNDDGSYSVVADFDAVAPTSGGDNSSTGIHLARGERSCQVTWSVDVTIDPALPQVSPKSLSFRQRQQFTTTVATFTAPPDAGSDVDAERFSALIDWGDGTTSAGAITRNWDGSFDISGTKTYPTKYGYVPVRVTVADAVTGRAVVTQSSVYLDHDPVEVDAGVPTVSTDGDGVVGGTLATFVDGDGPSNDPQRYRVYYAALVDWGDGHVTAGVVAQEEDGSYAVVSTHAYDASGEFDISILVRRNTRYAPVHYVVFDGGFITMADGLSTSAAGADQSTDFRVRLHVSVRRDGSVAPVGPTVAPIAPTQPTTARQRLTRPFRFATQPPATTEPEVALPLAAERPTPFAAEPIGETVATAVLEGTKDDLLGSDSPLFA